MGQLMGRVMGMESLANIQSLEFLITTTYSTHLIISSPLTSKFCQLSEIVIKFLIMARLPIPKFQSKSPVFSNLPLRYSVSIPRLILSNLLEYTMPQPPLRTDLFGSRARSFITVFQSEAPSHQESKIPYV